jgi:hypothetical protein
MAPPLGGSSRGHRFLSVTGRDFSTCYYGVIMLAVKNELTRISEKPPPTRPTLQTLPHLA